MTISVGFAPFRKCSRRRGRWTIPWKSTRWFSAMTYALESLEFPLYALRSRLAQRTGLSGCGALGMAELNLPQRLKNIHAQSVRFTRNIRARLGAPAQARSRAVQ